MKIESRSKEETKTYQEWFNLADSDGDGRISGNDTTKFFALSNLSRSQLKRLWALADVKRQGFLGFTEFVTAMQLVSLAQVGQELNSDILKTQSKCTFIIFPSSLEIAKMTLFPFITVDKENIKPPVLEGLDALVASGPDQRSIPGNTIVVDAHMPFGGLATFGGSFLSKFQCSQMPHPNKENASTNLFAMAVGIKQKDLVNKMVKKVISRGVLYKLFITNVLV
ncbi:Epidermal growth factor receptor substrate 15 like [Glycine soja]|uniref:Epidermal growth factor receptor substrate 15 like n=1 Tax=Glycine soja TaxID=3848 RepID=A0A0B2RW23_GLYSO|nr:Epidermal growth factor receptor substrate 15 like [Glycine soja]